MATVLALRQRVLAPRKPRPWSDSPRRFLASPHSLPAYLSPAEIASLLTLAPHPQARLLMLCQWRAGLRVSEALALRPADFSMDGDNPVLRVACGKGGKARTVPCHPELVAALHLTLAYAPKGPATLFTVDPSTAWRWVHRAYLRAAELELIPAGRHVGTHTLRHSAARHWLASGVPINVVSRWLGHASISTTLVYLEILPDPSGYMERVA